MIQEIYRQYSQYLIRGGYPAVVTATTVLQKKNRLKDILQKIYDKDVSHVFSGKERTSFADIMNVIAHMLMSGYKTKTICASLSLSASIINKYRDFLVRNHIMDLIPYFWSDKKRELSSQSCIAIDDM